MRRWQLLRVEVGLWSSEAATTSGSHIGTSGFRGKERNRGQGISKSIRSVCGLCVFGDMA